MTLADNAPVLPRAPMPGRLGRVFSRAYSIAINRINTRFDQGKGVVSFDRPVISVGNLSTGGTGKTPMVMHVVAALRDAGHDPCIAMRGYGSRRGTGSDEALEYGRVFDRLATASNKEAVPIVAQPHRTAGLIELFAGERGSRVDSIVLDDGFQHRQIARDLDIVLVDATRSPFQDSLLPAGHLREPVSSLARAHAVVITHAECSHADDVATLRVQIHERQPTCHIAVARHTWRDLIETSAGGEHARPVSFLSQKRVAAVAAIGNPLAFFDLAKTHAGRDLVLTRDLRDHDPYNDATVSGLLDELRRHRPDVLIVTEKDWSKLQRVSLDRWPCPVVRPSLQLTFDSGGSELRAMVLGVFE
jgi:tetraacyldisaccharide 4'-kinase